MKRVFVCHYHEIVLKGKNRSYFENRLEQNVRSALDKTNAKAVIRQYGRIVVGLPDQGDVNQVRERLKNIFGIAVVFQAWVASSKIELLEKQLWELVTTRSFQSFRITTRRVRKDYPLDSQAVNRRLGAYIQDRSHRSVNLNKPDLNCHVDLIGKQAFIYFDRERGSGGLPISTSGRVMVMISGGIDSPVAAFRIMKRGCRALYVHFHSYPQTTLASQEKVRELVQVLTKFQGQSKLFLVPFVQAQRHIVAYSKPALRVILYRRLMVRIAEAISRREHAQALVTGESIGQVASQTLANIHVISRVASQSILRPLIGFDKEEIIASARKIGTYEISILPDQDCCSLFVPKHPETKARAEDVEEAERKIELEALTRQALEETLMELIEDPINASPLGEEMPTI